MSVVLTGRENREVLAGLIVPTWTRGAARQEQPVVIFVAGQPGSGKTRLADLVHTVLDRRGGAVRIGSDLYKGAHRHYPRLLAEDVRTAGVKTRPDTRRWQAAVEEHARSHRFDAVVETALADPDEFRTAAAAYRQAGYRIEVVALATHESLSQLGLLDRYLSEIPAGGGRYVSWENHDGCARRLLTTLTAVEQERPADRITIVRRGMEALYGNELIDGSWSCPPAADKAVAAERSRPWTARGPPGRPPSSATSCPAPNGASTTSRCRPTGNWRSTEMPSAPSPSPSPCAGWPRPDRSHRASTTTACRLRSTGGRSRSSSSPRT
ncbi:zeta toxin family protein [Streptomyces sp. NPDC060064]|uniref:zeta toxin family protein n=1 Tax=Streptomyces sp. NPDC060064 TaxID=3347049 RepID=UPI0036AE12D1